MTANHTYAITTEIARRVTERVEGISEVEVHFTPRRGAAPDHMLVSRAAADALGLSVHEIVPVRVAGGVVLDMHVEMEGSLSLEEAHVQASELERRVRDELTDVIDVVTHIEPSPSGEPKATLSLASQDIRHKVLARVYDLYPDANWHDLRVVEDGKGYGLTLHCHLPGEVLLNEAHAIAERVEAQLRAELPQLTHVTIHTEPPE